MNKPEDLTQDEIQIRIDEARQEFASYKAQNLKLNMARGKPSSDQLDLSMPMLGMITTYNDCISEDGTDCRNYGELIGIPEARRLMASLLDDEPDNVIVFGNSSLNVMYDTLARCMAFGTAGHTPWSTYDHIKWICPVPGYDRHFTVTEAFNVEMIPVDLNDDGPDMESVKSIAAQDETVKGIWCVPKYSNPSGITYSDDVVRALAEMECAAPDFRIFWDNAYCVHHLFDDPDEQDRLYDIAAACREAGNPNRPFKFASTSKITFPGAGISGFASSPDNIAETKNHISAQIISHDKINQLRHVRFLRDAEGIAAHMAKHAAILRPKFELVLNKLDAGLADIKDCTWTRPRGGYFIFFRAPQGCASRIVELAKEAGVTLTGAGATWPYGRDPHDRDIRIAPTLPPLEELDAAMDVFVCCVKIAALEKLSEL